MPRLRFYTSRTRPLFYHEVFDETASTPSGPCCNPLLNGLLTGALTGKDGLRALQRLDWQGKDGAHGLYFARQFRRFGSIATSEQLTRIRGRQMTERHVRFCRISDPTSPAILCPGTSLTVQSERDIYRCFSVDDHIACVSNRAARISPRS